MKITVLDKNNLRLLRDALQKCVEQTGNEFGVKITIGRATYSPESATFKVEVATVANDGTVQTKAVSDFKLLCGSYGLKPEHLGAEITYARTHYRIVGLNPKRWRFPLLAERVPDGKKFCLPEDAARELQLKDGDDRMISAISNGQICDRKIAERKADELARDNPEAYHADGELAAQGMSPKQIREHWIQHFLKQPAA